MLDEASRVDAVFSLLAGWLRMVKPSDRQQRASARAAVLDAVR